MTSNVQDTIDIKEGQPAPRLQIYPTSASGVSSFWKGCSVFLHHISLFFSFSFFVDFFRLRSLCVFFLAEKYEREAKKYWDIFYKRHQDKVGFPLSFNFCCI